MVDVFVLASPEKVRGAAGPNSLLKGRGGGGGSRGIKSPLTPPPKEKEEIDARPEMEGAEGA